MNRKVLQQAISLAQKIKHIFVVTSDRSGLPHMAAAGKLTFSADNRVDGKARNLLVHRKGATRAFGPGMEGVPRCYRNVGQPVIIGGSMETGSYLLVGTPGGEQTFFSTAHGSGRTMSRTKARKIWRGKQLQQEMEGRGIYVRTASWAGLAEEAGGAYKDIDEVILATEQAGISKPVVRFTPIGNIKG